MELIIINLLNGISFGMILFILAMGLSITLGVMGILNLAHGSLFMIGGFIGVSIIRSGGSFWLATIIGSFGAAILGLVIERLFLARLYRQLDNQVLLTLGLIYIFGNIVLWIFGGRVQLFDPPALLSLKISIGKYAFPFYRMFLILIGTILFILIWWLIEKTRIGAIVRAGMDNKEMTMGLGINYSLTCSIVFTLGSFIGGFAGCMSIPFIGVVHSMALEILLYALIVVVVGGPGSVFGTLLGGLLIGIIDSLGKAFFPDLAMFTLYLVLIVTLLLKPTGLCGRSQIFESAGPPPLSIPSYNPKNRILKYTTYPILIFIFIILPPFLPMYLQSMATKILIFSIFALSLNLLWGYSGLISLGHATYFGVGAYASTIMIVHLGIENFWLATLIAIFVAGLIAVFYGVIALRVSGLYFLLVTLALGQLVFYVAEKWRSVTGGYNGIIGIPFPNIGIPKFNFNSIYFYFFVLIITAFCYFILNRIVNSPFGYALQGIRDDEKKMQTLGYNIWLYKYIAYILAGIFASVAGVLFSYFLVVVAPPQLSITTSTMALLILIIGGTQVFWGPIIGSVFVILLEYISSIYVPQRWPLILGTIFIISVMFLRDGIAVFLLKILNRLGNSGEGIKS